MCVFGSNIALDGSRDMAAMTHQNMVIHYSWLKWRTASFMVDDMLIAVLAVHSTAVYLIKNTQNLVETAVLLRFVMTVSKKNQFEAPLWANRRIYLSY